MTPVLRLLTALLCAAMTCAATAATDPMLGQWALSAADQTAHPESANALSVDAAAGGYIVRMGMKNFPPAMALHIIPDGKPHTYMTAAMGMDTPPGPAAMGTCTRAQPRVIKCQVQAPGQPAAKITITLSPDGKSLNMTDPDSTSTYVRPVKPAS